MAQRRKMEWAKVYCDLLRHPLLLGRPDSDVRLVLGLILYAKEYAPDGVLRGITAARAKQLCGITASIEEVQAGLDYLFNESPADESGRHWLYRLNDEAVMIRDFAERQARAGDTPAAHRLRQTAYRQRGNERAKELDLSELSDSDKTQVQRLFQQGRATAAIELFQMLRPKLPAGGGS
jgi:hypothetical protein